MTHDVERVFADIDTDHGDRCVEFLRHGVLLVLSAPCQLLALAGPEHGRTIPLAETKRHCLYEECFNGDGAVVSYLNGVGRIKETIVNLCHEAVDVADRQWTRKFVQEPADHKGVAAPDDLRVVVLGFTQMLSGGGNVDEVSRLATDHGWLDASGQLTAAGDQLARALLQQSGTRTIFRVW